MILLESILHDAINPALGMLPKKMDTPEARVMLLAIGLQESRFMFRYQKLVGRPYEKGPARGYWQFEEGGGVKGVMTHPDTEKLAKAVCDVLYVPFAQTQVHGTLEYNDTLAAAFARLLLWSDRLALPAIGDVDGAWKLYERTWRPGKPHPDTWADLYAKAAGQVVA